MLGGVQQPLGPLARRTPAAAITCACTDRLLRFPEWRIWTHRSRRWHTTTKSEFHRPRSEQCLYRSRHAGPARARAPPLGPEARLDLVDLVRRADPLDLADPLCRQGPLDLADPMRVGRIPRQRASR